MTLGQPRGDVQLMADVSAGSVDAFAELYDRYCDRAYRVALMVSHDEGRAQDAVQEGFLSIWKSRASYGAQRGTVGAWLLTVIRHRAIDVARRNAHHAIRRTHDDQLEAHPADGDVSERVIQRDDTDRLRASLALLPDAQQEVIMLAYYGQLSHAEIAAHLDLPGGTVKGRMRLGLQKLSANIQPAGADATVTGRAASGGQPRPQGAGDANRNGLV